MAEVGTQLVGDADLRLDHAGDVGGSVADLLDGARDVQDPGHGLGVLGTASGEHGHLAQPPEVAVHAGLELLDLLGQVLLVEEHGRVGQVHHQLGDVLGLHEELFDVPGLFVVRNVPPAPGRLLPPPGGGRWHAAVRGQLARRA